MVQIVRWSLPLKSNWEDENRMREISFGAYRLQDRTKITIFDVWKYYIRLGRSNYEKNMTRFLGGKESDVKTVPKLSWKVPQMTNSNNKLYKMTSRKIVKPDILLQVFTGGMRLVTALMSLFWFWWQYNHDDELSPTSAKSTSLMLLTYFIDIQFSSPT